MRRKVGYDGGHCIFDFTDPALHAVHFLREHLVPFRDQLQLVLKILGENADLRAKIVFDLSRRRFMRSVPG
jgi:cell division FtsZ-interacting protein ZapD